jgi:hypothetical protein
MIQHAQAANTRLLQNLPKGFALGGEHAPHVTVLLSRCTQSPEIAQNGCFTALKPRNLPW